MRRWASTSGCALPTRHVEAVVPRRTRVVREVPPLTPEVPEDRARGLVARLYQDIRETTGAPGVNLFFRELAAAEVLQDAWTSLRPLYASGDLPAAGARLRAVIGHPVRLPRIGSSLTIDAGMSAADLSRLRATLQHFAMTNAMNLVMMSVLLDGAHAAVGPTQGSLPKLEMSKGRNGPGLAVSAPRDELLPLPAHSEIASSSCSVMDAITLLLVPGPLTLRPTLLRHLAPWPTLLGAVWGLVAAKAGTFGDAVRHVEESARAEASGLAAPATELHVRERASRFRPAVSGFLVLASSLVVDEAAN